MRDDLRGYVVGAFGESDAILELDETGDPKAGDQSVGVQRQYTGMAGRIENSQVKVFMTYVGQRGDAFIDGALHLPRSWTEDRGRLPRRARQHLPGHRGLSKYWILRYQDIEVGNIRKHTT